MDIVLDKGFEVNVWTKNDKITALYVIHPKGQEECAFIHIVRDEDEIVDKRPEHYTVASVPMRCPNCGVKGQIFDGKWEPVSD